MSQLFNYKSPRLGQGAVFLCAVLWSTSGLFIKLIDWDPIVIAGMRSLIAGLFMLTVRFLSAKRRRSPFKLRYLWGGGFAYSITMLLFVPANKLTTSANAILLQYSAPVWAALLGWLLAKEKPRMVNWISLAMVIGGLCLFFKDGLAGGSSTGNLLALLSGISFGANSVFLRIQKEGDPADALILAHILTFLASIPFMFLHPPSFTAANTALILLMGIVQLGMASLLFAYGIKRVPVVQAMLTAAIEPILNPVWVLLVTGERPTIVALLGGLIIIAAVMVSTIDLSKKTSV
ncbi:MAG: DMT family transporter [Treponema sp.]|nr:DMT family transporter [Treponema sp.]